MIQRGAVDPGSQRYRRLSDRLGEVEPFFDLVPERDDARSIVRSRPGRIAWFCKPDLKMPWVATDDIAWLAAKELTNPRGRHRVYLEVGSEDVSMNELAEIIGKKIGKPVDYRYIETTRKDVEAEFLARFGTLEKW